MAALVAVAGPINAGALAAIPVPIILAAGWVYAAERCGLVATDEGIESRMTRRENTFRCRWTDIDGFELIGNGAQVAIVMQLCYGSRKLLPSTRAWFWDKRMVTQIRADLMREQAAARAHATR